MLLQGLNMATNAFLQWALGPQYEATLLGITNMPKPETRLTLDFSSLLGPLPPTPLCQPAYPRSSTHGFLRTHNVHHVLHAP